MAGQGTVKQGLKRIDAVIHAFAAIHGWRPGDYRVLRRFNVDWDYIHLRVQAKHFPGKTASEQWNILYDYLDEHLKGKGPRFSTISLSLGILDPTDETEQFFSETYIPLDELIVPGALI